MNKIKSQHWLIDRLTEHQFKPPLLNKSIHFINENLTGDKLMNGRVYAGK